MSGEGRILGRGTFDQGTRRKPLVLAGDAHPVTLYMEIEWQFRRLFARRGLERYFRNAHRRHNNPVLCPRLTGGEEENSSRGIHAKRPPRQRVRSSRLGASDLPAHSFSAALDRQLALSPLIAMNPSEYAIRGSRGIVIAGVWRFLLSAAALI